MATMATETDAAASLMALGRSSPETEDAIMADSNQNTDMAAGNVTSVDGSATASMDNTMQVDPMNPPFAPSASLSSSASSSASRSTSKKRAAPKKARGGGSSSSMKYTVKPKDPKVSTIISRGSGNNVNGCSWCNTPPALGVAHHMHYCSWCFLLFCSCILFVHMIH